MEFKTPLTNEVVRKKFNSQFDLVNYAIKLAENMIRSGRDTRIKTDSQNRALQILGEIAQDKDQLDEILDEPLEAEEGRRFDRVEREEEGRNSLKSAERKKTRKTLAE